MVTGEPPARAFAGVSGSNRSLGWLFEAIMKAKPHPEQGFRSCLGIISLVKSHGPLRVEAACRRGNAVGSTTYGSVASILKHGLDRAFAHDAASDDPPVRHGNIRGSGYYH